jgi:hypothetical protein
MLIYTVVFLFTIIIEFIALLFFCNKTSITYTFSIVVCINAISHPLMHLILFNFENIPIWLLEIGVMILESFILKTLGVKWSKTILIAVIINLFSWLFGTYLVNQFL